MLGLLFVGPAAVRADMGRVIADEVQVSETGQKAIVMHNMKEEILILGTDLKAARSTGILRFIPFPSEPKVSAAPVKAFEEALKLVAKHKLVYLYHTKNGGGASSQAVEINFQGRIGAHDLTVIRINDAAGFRKWVNNYFKSRGLPQKSSYPEVENVVADYTARGFVHFVLDYVDVGPAERTVDPLAFRFTSPKIYYPLRTSNTFGGEGWIDLLLFAPRTYCSALDYEFRGCMGFQYMNASTSAELKAEDVKAVHPDAVSFFQGQRIFLQAMKYYGKYQFENDILADPALGLEGADTWQGDNSPTPFDDLFEKPKN
jgi:hypothetical protein